MKLVIHPAVDSNRLDAIQEAAGPSQVVNAQSDDQVLNELSDADAFFGKITPERLAAAAQLRWIQSPTASLEHYVFPELISHPCTLTNMRGLFSDVIADHVLGFMTCFARQFHVYIRNQSNRQWAPVGGETERTSFESGPGTVSNIDRNHLNLADQTVGIVGLGHIGREIARRCHAIGMTVLGVDPCQHASDVIQRVWSPDDLSSLLFESDFVVIAAPHTPHTERMFSSEQFLQMKPTAYLINIGRGAIVHLNDLLDALQTGIIAGAGLDVFETEPLPEQHPLWEHPNVIITPHVAGACNRIAERHLEVLLENIRRFNDSKPLTNVVDKSLWF